MSGEPRANSIRERGDVKGCEASLSLIFFIWKRGIKVQGRREEECVN